MATEKKRRLNNTDRRVKRTKKALRDALLTLLEKKTINQISVTELTNLADVNRATFYFYYTDLLDMLQQIQSETYQSFKNIILETPENINTIEGFTEYCERLFVLCKEHESVVRFVFQNDINNQVYKQIQMLMLDAIPNTKAIYPKDNPVRFSTDFILNGIVGILIDWLDEGMTIPPRELAEFCAHIYLNGSINTKAIYSMKEQ